MNSERKERERERRRGGIEKVTGEERTNVSEDTLNKKISCFVWTEAQLLKHLPALACKVWGAHVRERALETRGSTVWLLPGLISLCQT